MKTAGGTNYGFDGDGRRVRVQQGGYSSIYYLWSSVLGQPVAEIVGDTGNLFQAYVYGPGGQMVALLSNDGTFYWNHPDHLGSGRKLTDSTGAVRYRGEFDPHGQTLLEVTAGGTGTYANSHRYTGYEREWSTNLDYAQARMFSHNRARFMQPDPLGLGAADLTAPQTLNRYAYVANDPVNFVDPGGLVTIDGRDEPTAGPLKTGGVGGAIFNGQGIMILQNWRWGVSNDYWGWIPDGIDLFGSGSGEAGGTGGGGGTSHEQVHSNNSPLQTKNSCTVQLYDRLIEAVHGIPIPGARHGYILFTDSNGQQRYFEGFHSGKMLTARESDPLNKALPKNNPDKNHLAGQTSGPEICDWLSILQKDVSAVNAANIKYNGLGPNSNSVLRYMLQSLPDKSWFRKRFMIGWGSRLPGVEP